LASERVQRRLAAVLAADVVGYSRLMGVDEEGTLVALKALRTSLIDPELKEHRGRIVKTTGDGVLAEFASTVDAVHCAINIQRAMSARNAELAPDKKMKIEFRIGINVGDIIVDGDDIFGDGVNVAARLESISPAGGICIADVVHQQVNGRVGAQFTDLGEQALKNIAQPLRVYSIALDEAGSQPITPMSSAAAAGDHPALVLPDTPSIAVLPFQNMSGDPEQEYFADGMVEDIITALSRFKELFVIARNSSFVYKGNVVDIQQVARELGVRYVLEGSVRKAGNRVRITGQLIDAATRAHLWADKFDGLLEDIFALQDGVTESVVGALAPTLHRSELERARRKPPDNLAAYDYVLRAFPHIFANTLPEARMAIPLLAEALRRDPDYALAHALFSGALAQIFRSAVGQERAALQKTAEEHARRALALDSDDGRVLTYAGWCLLIVAHDVTRGRAALHKATLVNPNLAVALAYHGLALALTGEPKAAIKDANKLLRLSPVDPHNFLAWQTIAIAQIDLNDYDEAAVAAQKTIDINPRYPMAYAWALVAECGRGDKAQAEARLRQLSESLPGFTAQGLPELFSMFPPEFRDKSLGLMRSQELIG
jgi:TolB-like protein/class 3 adenylate cyclase/Flp pilus assembly protein TadD